MSERHPPIDSLKLGNGLRLVVESDRRLPLVGAHLLLGAGSGDEPAERCGLAHLCEHLAFEGAGVPTRVETRGGTTGGATSPDATRFDTVLPSSELAFSLWAQARRLTPTAVPEELEVQRRVLVAERRQRVENRPYGRAVEEIQRLLYPPEHPYHRPPTGLPEGLEAITGDDAERFFAACYTPENAVLALVGDLDAATAGEQAEEFLGALPPAGSRPPKKAPPLSALDGERREVVADRVPAIRTYLACRAPGWGEKGRREAALWMDILAVDSASRLRRQLIGERRVAQQIDSYFLTMDHATTVAVAATAAPGVDRRRLEESLIEATEEALHRPVSAATFERTLKRTLKILYFRSQGLNDRALIYARRAARGEEPRSIAGGGERLRQMTPNDLAAAATTLFQPTERVVLSFVPEART